MFCIILYYEYILNTVLTNDWLTIIDEMHAAANRCKFLYPIITHEYDWNTITP